MSISALVQNSIFVLISFFVLKNECSSEICLCVSEELLSIALVSLDIESAHLFQKQRVLDKPLVLTRKD